MHQDRHVERVGGAGGDQVAARSRATHTRHNDESRTRGRGHRHRLQCESPAAVLGEFGEDAPGVVLVDALDRAQVVENHRSTIVNVIEIS